MSVTAISQLVQSPIRPLSSTATLSSRVLDVTKGIFVAIASLPFIYSASFPFFIGFSSAIIWGRVLQERLEEVRQTIGAVFNEGQLGKVLVTIIVLFFSFPFAWLGLSFYTGTLAAGTTFWAVHSCFTAGTAVGAYLRG